MGTRIFEGLLSGETLEQSTERSSSHLDVNDMVNMIVTKKGRIMIKIYSYDDDNDDDQAPCKSFIVGSAWLTDAREGWRTYLVRFALTLG